MIKIIKPGTKRTTTCDNCGCQFSYENEDVRHEEVCKNMKNISIREVVRCPQCHHQCIVEATR